MKKIIIILFCIMQFAAYSTAQSVEYTVKALLIEKFARFTNWETDITGEYFTIAVLGKSPFKGELEKNIAKTIIKNKPVKISYIKDMSECLDCNLVFVCASEKNKLPMVLSTLNTKPVLVISDSFGFTKKGVHMNFYFDSEGQVKYEINPKALEKSNLSVNMQLLKFGKIVN
ncbi:MAG TPA: hypothetical protein DCQ31_17290 [Bacteroidales bacterium]|nr:hypothetical protein [Bacteroidales bacterium]